MAAWLVVIERERRRSIDYVLAELKSEWHFDVDGKNFTLTTRIDRLEIHKGSHAAIIDYKTGTLPSASDIARGLANQLPLEALIAMQSPLPIGGGNIILEYWRLSGNEDNCDIVAVDAPLEETRERLVTLIRRFDDPATPYAAQNDPSLVPRYNDYAHLTRRQEWGEF